MTGLPPQFFDRSFHAVDDAMRNAGASVVGPPLGLYYGMPTDTVDVAAGFPTDRDVSVDGEVTTETLPGGRAAQILHIGSYDAMEQTYGRLMQWLQAQNLRPAGGDVGELPDRARRERSVVDADPDRVAVGGLDDAQRVPGAIGSREETTKASSSRRDLCLCGPGWDRTSDLPGVNGTLFH